VPLIFCNPIVVVMQSVRRNYSLTVKDLEADRQKNFERVLTLKMASSGN